MIVLGMVGLLIGVMLLGALGRGVVLRARAQSAADAAALAGAVEGEPAAVELARRNGATLVEFEERGTAVHVIVDVHGVRAEASAELDLELGVAG